MNDDGPSCSENDHEVRDFAVNEASCERAAAIFRALGDPQRLRLLLILEAGQCCVSEIASALNEPLPAISQRLRVLKGERVVKSRREGKHVFYALADEHISRLVANGVMHAMEELS
ncbi:MAG: metalloregulator ArsR/SmtB family transcription factor [Planctomycetota bacterium]